MRILALLPLTVIACAGCGGDSDPTTDAAGDVAIDTHPDSPLGGTVTGTLTLPGTAFGRPLGVRILASAGSAGAPVAQTAEDFSNGTTSQTYSIANVPAGTYFVLGFVDVDGTGGKGSTDGDYVGWYGHTGDGNPPGAANAVVPLSGTVTFDFSLIVR